MNSTLFFHYFHYFFHSLCIQYYFFLVFFPSNFSFISLILLFQFLVHFSFSYFVLLFLFLISMSFFCCFPLSIPYSYCLFLLSSHNHLFIFPLVFLYFFSITFLFPLLLFFVFWLLILLLWLRGGQLVLLLFCFDLPAPIQNIQDVEGVESQ